MYITYIWNSQYSSSVFFCKRITACTVFDSLRGNLSLAVSSFRIPWLGNKEGGTIPCLQRGNGWPYHSWRAPNQRRSLFSIGMWEFSTRKGKSHNQLVLNYIFRCCEYKNARETWFYIRSNSGWLGHGLWCTHRRRKGGGGEEEGVRRSPKPNGLFPPTYGRSRPLKVSWVGQLKRQRLLSYSSSLSYKNEKCK